MKSSLTISGSQENCTTIYILPDENVTVENRWALLPNDNSAKYNLSATQVGIKINYIGLESGKYKFCFKASKNDEFYGVIFFKNNNDIVKIGSLVEIDSINQQELEKIYLFTSDAIKNIDRPDFGLSFIFILLLAILGLLIFRSNKSSAPEQKR